MGIDPWTIGAASWRALFPASLETPSLPVTPVVSNAPVSLAETHATFQRLTRSGEDASAARLFGIGLPLIPDLSAGQWVAIVAGTGVAALLLRGAYTIWASINRPFGDLTELNRLVHLWPVTDEADARALAARIGNAFVEKARSVTADYDNEHLQVPWNVNPKDWARRDEIRQRLTTRYARNIGEILQQFARGVSQLSQKDYGAVYEDVFGGFMHNVFLAFGPLTRFEHPLNDEDEANFLHFHKTLRRELLALEMKLGELSEPHAA